MRQEFIMADELFGMDAHYGDCWGMMEERYDYIAICEVGEMYRDIRHMNDRIRYYEELCA